MKPWFEKESNVIPFPKPKAKVIQMPNVGSYPDFLTGVKDLHNRKERGEISQDSHDKLYQDLIHRFMKKESFETPWFLREDAQLNEGVFDIIKKITNLVKINGPIILQKIIDFIKNKFKKQPQVQENTAVADLKTITDIGTKNPQVLIDAYKQVIDALAKPIKDTIQSFAQKFRVPVKVLAHLTQETILQSHKPDTIQNAVKWLASGPLKDSFNTAKNQSLNVLDTLKQKDKTLTDIIAQENLLFDLARMKELGGRGEGLMQILFTGGISGGREGAKGDVKIGNEEYEVKANGRKSDGSASPVVFTGRGNEDKPKIIKAGNFIKDYITDKTGKKDHLTDNGKMRAERGAPKQGGKESNKISFNSYNMKGMTDFIDTLNKADATTFLTRPLEIMFDKVPKQAEKYIKQSVATRPFQPNLYSKAFMIANANYYLTQKQFSGVIFLDITAGNQENMLIRVFERDKILKQVEDGTIYRIRTESINSMLGGETQSAFPGLANK
jgi:hypothetical protein